jgi:hypothetical protein
MGDGGSIITVIMALIEGGSIITKVLIVRANVCICVCRGKATDTARGAWLISVNMAYRI